MPHTRARDALIGAHPHLQMDRVRSQGHVHDGAFTRGAHPAHAAARDTRPRRFVPGLAADLPHARTVPATKKTHGPGTKTQPIQPQQALTIEHAKIRDRPCPILFIIHTTNDGARPLHTKKGRARIVAKQESRSLYGFGTLVCGGGCEIRTREAVTPTRFPSVRHRPLGESS